MAIARESGSRVVVVVGLSIVRPTTKQWGKVEVGLGFGNYFTKNPSYTKNISHSITNMCEGSKYFKFEANLRLFQQYGKLLHFF